MLNWLKRKQSPAPQAAGILNAEIIDDLKKRKAVAALSLFNVPVIEAVDESGGKMAMDSGLKATMDSNINLAKAAFAGVGYGVNEQQLSYFASQTFVGYQVAAIMSQNWLIDKICTMPARDAVRNGYDLTSNDGSKVPPEVMQYILDGEKKMRVKENLVQFKRFCRIFGIRVAMFKIDVPNPKEFYENPFNIDSVKPGSYKGISQIDPYWIYPELDGAAASDPSAINFYEPTWWRIGNLRVHTSHLIVIRNDEVPDILKPVYYYGGISIPQKICERVYAAEITANEAPKLVMTKRVTVAKMDLRAAGANQASVDARLAAWVQFRDNYGVKIVGVNEEMEQFDISLSDVDAVIMTQYQIASAAGEVPSTRVLETQPKGFNSTGEHELKSYHERLESIQEHDLTPLVERHTELYMRSYVLPKFGKEYKLVPVWNPVDSPSAVELADINLKKAQYYGALQLAGAIDGTDIRQVLIADKNSGFNNLSDDTPETPQDDDLDEGDDTQEGQTLY